MTSPAPGFSGCTIDRADHLREDAAAMATLRAHPRAKLLLLDGINPMLDEQGSLRWTTFNANQLDADLAFLGLQEETPCFAALNSVPSAARFSTELWGVIELMSGDEAGLYGMVRSLVDWHNRHRFCARCGTATLVHRAGWARRCDNCRAQHFPRTDPVVIMVAEFEDRILLGRQPQFPAGRYSALAGFLEVGETIEGAVMRELKEEAGVEASDVRYITSQPWPFPSSLMIACTAKAASSDIILDQNELEDANWFNRAEVRAALAGDPDAPFTGPPPFAVAHTLLRHWLDTDANAPR